MFKLKKKFKNIFQLIFLSNKTQNQVIVCMFFLTYFLDCFFVMYEILKMSRSIATGESRSIAFKKLTKQSIRDIHERILNEKLKVEINDSEKKQNDNNIEENSSSRKTSKNKHEKQGPILEPNKDFIVGNNLPNRYHHLFPENFYGVPIEEIDPYWKNKYVTTLKIFF